jgi:hypothetical protein
MTMSMSSAISPPQPASAVGSGEEPRVLRMGGTRQGREGDAFPALSAVRGFDQSSEMLCV